MVDDIGLVKQHHLLQLPLVADVKDVHIHTVHPVDFHNLALEEETGRLGLVDEDEFLIGEFQQLAHNLAADRTRRARDHYGLAVQLRVEQGEVQLDGVALKQVLNAHLLDLLKTQVAVQPTRHGRHLEHLHVVRQSQLRDFLDLGIGDFLNGNDEEGDVVVAEKLLQMLELEHGQRFQLHPDFVLILVEEGQHIVFGGVVAVDGALGGDTRRARAKNDDVLAPLGGVHRLQIIKFEGETVEYQEHHRDEKLHHQHRGGH